MGTVRSDPDSHAVVSRRSVDFPDPSEPRNAIATPPVGTIRPSGRGERARPWDRALAATDSSRHHLRHLAPPAPVQSIAVEHWGGTASKRPHFGKRRLSGDDVGHQVRGSGAQQSARQVGHRPGISPQPPMHLAEPPGTTPWGTEPMPNPGAESEVECDLNEQEQELDRRINYVHPCLPIEAPGGEDQRFPRQAVLAQALVADRQMVTHMQMPDSAGVLLEGQVVVFATGVRGEGGRYHALKAGLG